jgi:hypothetical protein
MKKAIVLYLAIFFFAQCKDRPVQEKKNSSVGKLSINELPNFHLEKDTLQVEVDTLGYYFIANPPRDKENLKSVIRTAEVFHYYPNGSLKTSLHFCNARWSHCQFKIVLHGSPSASFNEIMTFSFVDSFALVTHLIPFHRKTGSCEMRTDSLQVTLNKYPVEKGDMVKGSFFYKGWKDCMILDGNHQRAGEPLIYGGFFECRVE